MQRSQAAAGWVPNGITGTNYGGQNYGKPYLIDPIRDDDFAEQLSKVSS